ncbi:hypothetical protein NIES4101_74070 [Calothrix sp. NIES-4101]|nr:hypothetical protein NIES4101_74070 [Calothrix sp. NIES-4101]
MSNNQPNPTQPYRYSDRMKELIGQACDALYEARRSNPKEWELLQKQSLLWCEDGGIFDAISIVRECCDIVNTDNLMDDNDD